MSKTKYFTYSDIEQMFHTEVERHRQDALRVPARDSRPEAILHFAHALYNAVYKDALHPHVIERYKRAVQLENHTVHLPRKTILGVKNVKALFTGKNGSCGYITGKTYRLRMVMLGNGSIEVTRITAGGDVVYESMNAMLNNWDNITKIVV